MKNSAIMNFIMFVIHSFSDWFDSSIFGKLGRKFGKLWQRITKKSFFVNYFSTSNENTEHGESSYICSLFKSVLMFFEKPVSKLYTSCVDSALVSALRWYYKNFFDISIAHYGVFLIGASVAYCGILAVSGNLSMIWAAVCVAVAVVGILAVLINLSLSSLFSGSFLMKIFKKATALEIPVEKETIPLKPVSALVFAISGIAYACLAHVVGGIYSVLPFAGIIGMGAVLYNFKIGVFAALVIFPYAPTMAIVGITLLTIFSFGLKYITDKDFHFVRTSLDIPVLIFMAVLFVSTITSYALISSIKIFMVYIVFVAGYFMITNAIKDFKTLMPVLVIMIIASFGVSAYGIYQHIFGFAEGKTWTDTEMFTDIATRVVSTFENPNVLGEYLLLLIPVGIAMFISSKSAFARTEHLLITAALGLCMIYTYSRGNWIGLIVAVGLFVLFYDSRFVWLGIIALFSAPFVLSENVINRFASIGDTKDSSTSYRVYIWKGTFDMLKDYWICGLGLGTDAFNMVYPSYSYETIVAPHSHNLYLQLVAENGIFGLVSFLAIMVAYFKTVVSKIIKQNHSLYKAIILSLAAGIFGYLVQGLFDNVWYNYRVFYMFFAVLGLTMAAVNASGEEKNND